MLEIKNICKTFLKNTPDQHIALDNLSLTVPDGAFYTIIGSNGAGKSSLFNAICGSFILDSGSIVLDGENITFKPEHKRAKYIGRVFQDPMKGTAPDMTISENLALAYARVHHAALGMAINRKDLNMFRERLASFGMGLEDRMNTKIGTLSGGQRQVITLLMCTLTVPKLLLLDEHTAALDPATAQRVMEITQKIVSENSITTLMITHNISTAMSCGNGTLMLDSGSIALNLDAETRAAMTVSDLLRMYSGKKHKEFDNDRILFSAE